MKRFFFCFLCAIFFFNMIPSIGVHAADTETKIAAFTFDDGPSRTITPKLLDALAERDVCVTFFVNGINAENNPDIILRAASEGHQIANHTYSHAVLTKLSSEKVLEEVSRTQKFLCELLGEDEYPVRVPYGSINERVQALIDAPIILWSVDPTSGKRVSAEKMRDGIVATAHDGAIILMHDTSTANLEASIAAIDILLDEGYVFVTIDELFDLKNVTPASSTIYRKLTGETSGIFDESQLCEHWAYEAISYVENAGIMIGDDGGFHPNTAMTRAEAAAVLWRMAGEPEPGSLKTLFTDIPSDAWYLPAVAWAYESGIVHGVTQESFCPQRRVTREAFYTMFENYLCISGLSAPKTPVTLAFRDTAAISEWAGSSVRAIAARGFVSREERARFYPKLGLTRAEAAELAAWGKSLSVL